MAQGAAYYGLVRRGLGARIGGGTPRAFYVGVGQRRAAARGDTRGVPGAQGPRRGPGGRARPRLRAGHQPAGQLPALLVELARRPPGRRWSRSATAMPETHRRRQRPARAAADRDRAARARPRRRHGAPRGAHHRAGRARDLVPRAGGAAARAAGGSASTCAPAAPPGADDGQAGARGRSARRRGARRWSPPRSARPASVGRVRPRSRRLEELLAARRDEWSVSLCARAVRRRARGRGVAQAVGRARGALAEPVPASACAPATARRSTSGARARCGGSSTWACIHEKAEQCRLAWWILWRRIAGGLTQGQQEQIYDRLAQLFLPGAGRRRSWPRSSPPARRPPRCCATLANLERLTVSSKIKLGDELVRRLGEGRKAREDGLPFWALGRIGARAPLYGPTQRGGPARPGRRVADARCCAMDWPDPDKAALPDGPARPPHRRPRARPRRVAPPARWPRGCAAPPAASAWPAWSRRSSRSRPARSGSRSATRCRPGCGCSTTAEAAERARAAGAR